MGGLWLVVRFCVQVGGVGGRFRFRNEETHTHERRRGGCMMEAGDALIGCCCEGASSLSLSRFSTLSQAGWLKERKKTTS
jgi:ribonuclease PH